MWTRVQLYSTTQHLIIQLGPLQPIQWHSDITAICDRNDAGQLCGFEVFLYEDSAITLEQMREQFVGSENVIVDEHGLMHIGLGHGRIPIRGRGYGRRARLGMDNNGHVSVIYIPWDAPGAGVPNVDPQIVLEGLLTTDGEPIFRSK